MKLTDEQKAAVKHLLSTLEDTELAGIIQETLNMFEAVQVLETMDAGRELPDIDNFGGCPECTRNDGYLNIHRAHWFMCHQHRTKWFVGTNLFSAWRSETEEDWEQNYQCIRNYREVEPLRSPTYLKPSSERLELPLVQEFDDDWSLPF